MLELDNDEVSTCSSADFVAALTNSIAAAKAGHAGLEDALGLVCKRLARIEAHITSIDEGGQAQVQVQVVDALAERLTHVEDDIDGVGAELDTLRQKLDIVSSNVIGGQEGSESWGVESVEYELDSSSLEETKAQSKQRESQRGEEETSRAEAEQRESLNQAGEEAEAHSEQREGQTEAGEETSRAEAAKSGAEQDAGAAGAVAELELQQEAMEQEECGDSAEEPPCKEIEEQSKQEPAPIVEEEKEEKEEHQGGEEADANAAEVEPQVAEVGEELVTRQEEGGQEMSIREGDEGEQHEEEVADEPQCTTAGKEDTEAVAAADAAANAQAEGEEPAQEQQAKEEQVRQLNAAATRIQSKHRQRNARKSVTRMRQVASSNQAAVKLQSLQRVRSAKKKVAEIKSTGFSDMLYGTRILGEMPAWRQRALERWRQIRVSRAALVHKMHRQRMTQRKVSKSQTMLSRVERLEKAVGINALIDAPNKVDKLTQAMQRWISVSSEHRLRIAHDQFALQQSSRPGLQPQVQVLLTRTLSELASHVGDAVEDGVYIREGECAVRDCLEHIAKSANELRRLGEALGEDLSADPDYFLLRLQFLVRLILDALSDQEVCQHLSHIIVDPWLECLCAQAAMGSCHESDEHKPKLSCKSGEDRSRGKASWKKKAKIVGLVGVMMVKAREKSISGRPEGDDSDDDEELHVTMRQMFVLVLHELTSAGMALSISSGSNLKGQESVELLRQDTERLQVLLEQMKHAMQQHQQDIRHELGGAVSGLDTRMTQGLKECQGVPADVVERLVRRGVEASVMQLKEEVTGKAEASSASHTQSMQQIKQCLLELRDTLPEEGALEKLSQQVRCKVDRQQLSGQMSKLMRKITSLFKDEEDDDPAMVKQKCLSCDRLYHKASFQQLSNQIPEIFTEAASYASGSAANSTSSSPHPLQRVRLDAIEAIDQDQEQDQDQDQGNSGEALRGIDHDREASAHIGGGKGERGGRGRGRVRPNSATGRWQVGAPLGTAGAARPMSAQPLSARVKSTMSPVQKRALEAEVAKLKRQERQLIHRSRDGLGNPTVREYAAKVSKQRDLVVNMTEGRGHVTSLAYHKKNNISMAKPQQQQQSRLGPW